MTEPVDPALFKGASSKSIIDRFLQLSAMIRKNGRPVRACVFGGLRNISRTPGVAPGVHLWLYKPALFLDADDVLGQRLFAGDVALAGDHDALRLRGAGAVHGLGAVADGGRAEREVFD